MRGLEKTALGGANIHGDMVTYTVKIEGITNVMSKQIIKKRVGNIDRISTNAIKINYLYRKRFQNSNSH